MNKQHLFKTMVVAVGLLASSTLFGQATVLGNFGGPTDYLGWDSNTGLPLRVMNNGDHPIQWFTDSIQRMQLWNSRAGTVNGLDISQNGYVGISNQPLFFNSAAGPFSRLHLADSSASNNHLDFAQQYGFRRWMRNGITMTGNKDQCYLGQKYNGTSFPNDSSDLVLQWSDNPADQAWPTDRLRFLFTTGLVPSQAYGAASNEGLESFRVFIPDDTTANVGIGDWWKATVLNGGVAVDPTERLDVLDGRVRIRELPEPAGETTGTFKLMVVDDTPSPSGERGVVKWVDPNDLPGGADCDWEMNASNNRLTTAWQPVNTNGNCPEADWNVGVGTNVPTAKLHVARDVNSGSGNNGGYFELTGTAAGKRGLWGNVQGSGAQHSGVRGETVNGTVRNYGVAGHATLEDGVSGVENYGGFGVATVEDGANGSRNAGIWGEGKVPGSATNNYGVFGNAQVSGTVGQNQGIYAWGRANEEATIGSNYGVNALANALSSSEVDTNYAVYALASAGAGSVVVNYGIYGRANGNSSVARNYGVRARSGGPSSVNYGIFAQATGGGMDWAGYFVGDVHATGNVTWSSDEMLKSEIEQLDNALEIIGVLQPKRYNFRTDEFAQLNLPEGNRMGLIAQDVQQVLPVLVRPVSHPEEYDEETGITHPAVDYLSLNYAELIPLLIAGIQEQQAELDSQQEANDAMQGEMDELRQRMDQLEQALALCCTNPSDGQQLQTPGDGTEGRMLPDAGSERLLTIAPNPFTEQTTVSYTLERGGRAMLMVHGSDGKHLQILEEGARSEGKYQYVWHTAHLAPGVYYVTLLLDGEPLVKRAVKVR